MNWKKLDVYCCQCEDYFYYIYENKKEHSEYSVYLNDLCLMKNKFNKLDVAKRFAEDHQKFVMNYNCHYC